MNQTLTLGEAGSLLLGAGLTQITTNVKIGLVLVGVGSILKIIVAVLDKNGIEVQSQIG